jgi:hypothetical protein
VRHRAGRIVAAALVLLGAAYLGFGSGAASTLGGLATKNVAATATAVGSCDSDGVDISYEVGTGPAGGPVLTAVDLTGVSDRCDGLQATVTLNDADGNRLGTVVGPVAQPATRLVLASPPDAGRVGEVGVVIS